MTPFSPIGNSVVIPYADDSTDQAVTVNMGAAGCPNVLYAVNPDTANVVAVNISFDPDDTNAKVPDSGANGIGTVIAPFGYAMIAIPQAPNAVTTFYISAAGTSATGNVYITPGVTFNK
jgi:hypothetical protein